MRELAVFLAAAAAAFPAGVRIERGAVNSVALPAGAAIYGAPGARTVLVTHARRDVLWAAGGAALIVPAGEAGTLTGAAEFWRLFRKARFHDYEQRTTKLPERPMAIARTVRGGDILRFGALEVQVLDTPGFTPGAVTYLFTSAGKRYAATGDLIYSGGRLLDIYSLQDSIAETRTRGYHGFAARSGRLIESLRRVKEARPDILVPARGPLIHDPAGEIERLIARLQALLESHFATDALLWYWGEENWRLRARLATGHPPPPPLPMAPQKDLPDWVLAIGNSRLLLSSSGAAFLIDAGAARIVERLEELRRQGRFRDLEGLWISHYHDDHTNHAAEVASRFGARVYFDERLRDILEHPERYRMPCLTANPVSGQPLGDAHSWQWREFRLTNYYFPGQTLYHGGLAVECGGEKLFFAGDSFTPSGIDDYCLQNRNFAGAGQGYHYCLDLLEKLGRDYWLINQHVAPMFRFDAGFVARLRGELEKRERILAGLTPLPGANYAADEGWARLYPYAARARPGEDAVLELRLYNHAAGPLAFRVRWNAPPGWRLKEGGRSVLIPPRSEGTVRARLAAVSPPEVAVLTVDVAFAGFDLRRWTEALLEGGPQPRSDGPGRPRLPPAGSPQVRFSEPR